MAGLAIALLATMPVDATALTNLKCSNGACIYNNSNFRADAMDAYPTTNPWNVVAGDYANLNGATDNSNKLKPFPHTYNSPNACNDANQDAFYPPCNENDTISSVRDTRSWSLRLFNNAYFTGSYQTMQGMTSLSQVRNNDAISSFCFADGTNCEGF